MKHRAVVTLLHMKHPELRQLLEYYRRGVFKTPSIIYSRGLFRDFSIGSIRRKLNGNSYLIQKKHGIKVASRNAERPK